MIHVREDDLHAYVSNVLDGDRRAFLEGHVLACEACGHELQRHAQAEAAMYELAPRLRRSATRTRWMAATAGVAVTVAAVLLLRVGLRSDAVGADGANAGARFAYPADAGGPQPDEPVSNDAVAERMGLDAGG